MANLEISIRCCYREIRRLQCDYRRTHLRMNIAEDVRHARLREAFLPCAPAFIKPQVEGLATINRKHIVEKWVLIGELDFRAHPDRYYMRRESFFFLQQARYRRGR